MNTDFPSADPRLRVVFAGTPDFAATALAALLNANHNLLATYTQPDRPAGRGQKVSYSPVKKLALKHRLPVYQPINFKDPEAVDQLAELRPNVMIVAAYGIMLPTSVLKIPKYGCINIHASVLPRWRGAAPIQRAIQAGDQQTGISIMQMDAGLDTGPVLLTRTTPIYDNDTSATLHDRLAQLGGETIVEALSQLHRLIPNPQDNQLATYAHRLAKREGSIDWALPASKIQRQLRAFSPWPGCFCRIQGINVKIHEAEVLAASEAVGKVYYGTILTRSASGIRIACGEGCLNITRLQLPGAKAMEVADFVNGNHELLMPGQRLSEELI